MRYPNRIMYSEYHHMLNGNFVVQPDPYAYIREHHPDIVQTKDITHNVYRCQTCDEGRANCGCVNRLFNE